MMQGAMKRSREATLSKPHASHARGKAGEEQALAFLAREGLVLVERNFRCRGGEIDLVMRQGDEIIFVEVRARIKGTFGGAAASITANKQARLIHAAQTFLQRFRRLPPCRFDAIAIEGERVFWLKNVIEN